MTDPYSRSRDAQGMTPDRQVSFRNDRPTRYLPGGHSAGRTAAPPEGTPAPRPSLPTLALAVIAAALASLTTAVAQVPQPAQQPGATPRGGSPQQVGDPRQAGNPRQPGTRQQPGYPQRPGMRQRPGYPQRPGIRGRDGTPQVPVGGVQPGAGAALNQVTEFEGTLKVSRGNMVMVGREGEADVLVQVPDDVADLTFVAEATPEFLRPGMSVRFESEFGADGVPTGPVDRLEVFHPVPATRLNRVLRERFVPGVYPQGQPPAGQPAAAAAGEPATVPGGPPDARGRQAAPGPANTTARYRVVGSLVGRDENGMMMIRAGNRPLRIPLADEADIEIRFNNLTLAQPEDAVTVAGFFQPPDQTRVKAAKMMIHSDHVFGEAVEGDAPRGTRGRRGRGAANPAGPPGGRR